MLEQDRPRMII